MLRRLHFRLNRPAIWAEVSEPRATEMLFRPLQDPSRVRALGNHSCRPRLVTRLPQADIECLAVINTSRPRGGAVAIVNGNCDDGSDVVYPWLFTGEIPG